MNEVANETVQQLGLAVGRDPNLPADWHSLWLVFKVGDGYVEHFGDFKVQDSDPISFLLDSDNAAKKLIRRLHDVMYDEDGKSWLTCKMSLIRETKDVKITFEYDDEDRWEEPF